jgi:hypothetical protein
MSTRRSEHLAERVQSGEHAALQPERRGHPMASRSIQKRYVHLVKDQMCDARREKFVHDIEHREERVTVPLTLYTLSTKRTALALPECSSLVPERPEHSAQCTRVIVREGTACAV